MGRFYLPPFPSTPLLVSGANVANPASATFVDSPDGTAYGNVQSNGTDIVALSTDSWNYWNVPFSQNQEVWATMGTSRGRMGLYMGLGTIGTTNVDGFAMDLRLMNQPWLRRLINNAETDLGSVNLDRLVDTGDTFGMRRVGDVVTLYVKYLGSTIASELFSYYDPTPPTSGPGYVGLYLNNIDRQVSRFGGGPIGGPRGSNVKGNRKSRLTA